MPLPDAPAFLPQPDPGFYPGIGHQSLLLTSRTAYHLLKNLSFVLDYQAPPSSKYTVINARNPDFQNKFYSRLLYVPDPSDRYLWLYCWAGFLGVGLALLGLRVLSELMERGVIRWSRSASSEDEASAPGVTVYFNSQSGGMITD